MKKIKKKKNKIKRAFPDQRIWIPELSNTRIIRADDDYGLPSALIKYK